MKPLIYVAGPITGDPFGCLRQAIPVFDRLRDMGAIPFLPQWSIIHEIVEAQPYEAWMAYDLDVIRRSDALVRLQGASPGADREVAFAGDLGVPVFFAERGLPMWADLSEWLDAWTGVARVRWPSAFEPTKPSYVYVASSWRNPMQPAVVASLRAAGIDCYDFRNPEGGTGFSWRDTCPTCHGRPCHVHVPGVGGCVFSLGHHGEHLTEREADGYRRNCAACGAEPGGVAAKGTDHVSVDTYLAMLAHPRAEAGFAADFAAMEQADTFVLVLPCGRSAHLELGWAVGAGKRTAILLEDPAEPELMYRMVDHLAPSMLDLLGWLGVDDDAEVVAHA